MGLIPPWPLPLDPRSPTQPQAKPHGLHWVWVVLAAVVAGWIALTSPVDHAGSDPKGCLLTAQAILWTGSARLDGYASQPNSWVSRYEVDRFSFRRGHIYYAPPMGPCLLALPVVFVFNLQGKDMHKPTNDAEVQNLLSAVMVASCVPVSYALATRFLSPGWALWVAVAYVLGGPVISTMGTAYWNSGVASLLVLVVMLLLVDLWMGLPASVGWLAFLLVMTAASRPTALPLVALSLPYVWVVQPRRFVRFAASLVLFGALVLALHLVLYDGLNASYYRPARVARPFLMMVVAVGGGVALALWANRAARRLSHLTVGGPIPLGRAAGLGLTLGAASLPLVLALLLPGVVNRLGTWALLPGAWEVRETLRALWGVLASPSRGVLVYSPYLLLTLGGVKARWTTLRRSPLAWLCFLWLAVHTLVAARPGRWHGGHCFGSRMFLEVFPAFLVTSLLTAPWWMGGWRRRAVVVLVVTSVFMNTLQGALNRWTILWNRDPDVDADPCYLWSWRYRPFLASPMLLEARARDYEARGRVCEPKRVEPLGAGRVTESGEALVK